MRDLVSGTLYHLAPVPTQCRCTSLRAERRRTHVRSKEPRAASGRESAAARRSARKVSTLVLFDAFDKLLGDHAARRGGSWG